MASAPNSELFSYFGLNRKDFLLKPLCSLDVAGFFTGYVYLQGNKNNQKQGSIYSDGFAKEIMQP